MPRPQYEWRRVLTWPSGDCVPSFPSGELQARADCAPARGVAARVADSAVARGDREDVTYG